MSTGAIYCWGFLGGFYAAGFVYVLPLLGPAATHGAAGLTKDRAVAMTCLVAFLSAAAGVVPLIPDQVTRGQAICLGFASQTIIKGLISGVRDALGAGAPSPAPG